MTRTIRLPMLLTALVLLGASQARGDMIDFSYTWSVQPSSVIPGGTGSVTLATAPDGASQATLGSSTPTVIPGASVTTTSSADPALPDSFNTPFNMKLTLKDTLSGSMGDLTFSGTLAGTLSSTSSTLTSTFDEPVTKTLTLGGRVYTVTIDPSLVNVPQPGGTEALIDARIMVANAGNNDPPPTHTTPEPSALLLGATALLGVASRALRRRIRRT